MPIEFLPPASAKDIHDLEDELAITLPEELKSLLLKTNGIRDKKGVGIIWDTDRIVRENKELRKDPVYREHYQPFSMFLFFSDTDNGDLFAFKYDRNQPAAKSIYIWNHDDDSRKEVAATLHDFLEGRMKGFTGV
jgi:hypothetical protein